MTASMSSTMVWISLKTEIRDSASSIARAATVSMVGGRIESVVLTVELIATTISAKLLMIVGASSSTTAVTTASSAQRLESTSSYFYI